MRFHPGYYVRRLMGERGVSREDLPSFLGVSESDAEALIEDRLRVDPYMAKRLADAFGASETLWLNPQRSWDDDK